MASGSWKEIKLWEIQRLHCFKTLKGHEHYVRCLEQLKENSILISGSQDQTIKFWDINHGTCLKTVHAHDDVIWCLQRLPNNQFASGSFDTLIKIWTNDNDIKENQSEFYSECKAIYAIFIYSLNDIK